MASIVKSLQLPEGKNLFFFHSCASSPHHEDSSGTNLSQLGGRLPRSWNEKVSEHGPVRATPSQALLATYFYESWHANKQTHIHFYEWSDWNKDMAKVGGTLSVLKVCTSMLCPKNMVAVSGWPPICWEGFHTDFNIPSKSTLYCFTTCVLRKFCPLLIHIQRNKHIGTYNYTTNTN